jgi:hypothetical protein
LGFFEFCGWVPAYTVVAWLKPTVLKPLGVSALLKKDWQLWLGWPWLPVEFAYTGSENSVIAPSARTIAVRRFIGSTPVQGIGAVLSGP